MKQLSSDEILKKVNDFLDHLPYDRKRYNMCLPLAANASVLFLPCWVTTSGASSPRIS